jgi:hypothetical protein
VVSERDPAADQEPGTALQQSRHAWVAVGLAVVALGAGVYAVGKAGDSTPRAVPHQSAGAAAPHSSRAEDVSAAGRSRVEDTAVPDRTGADGVFVVTVTGVRCGVAQIGPGASPQRAAGEFCLVTVTAENAGPAAHLFDPRAQRVVDARGRSYAVASRAAAFLDDRGRGLRGHIPAGHSVRGVLPFDVPRGTTLAALVLHDTAGSRGARVPLR